MIAFDNVSNPIPGASNLTWTHTPVGAPQGVILFIVQYLGATDEVLGCTYGGVPMVELAVSPQLKATGEAGAVYCYVLTGSVPGGQQTVLVTVSGASVKAAVCATLTANAILEIQDTLIVNSDSIANPQGLLELGSKSCWCAMGFMSGQGVVTGITPLTNWAGYEFDFGNACAGVYRYNIVGAQDVTAGWTQAADDALGIAVAVREAAGAPADIRAHIHELFFAYSPPIPDQNLDIVVQALDEAIGAIWNWGIANTADLAANLPEPFRSRTNAYQKYLLLALMAAEQTGGLLTISPLEAV